MYTDALYYCFPQTTVVAGIFCRLNGQPICVPLDPANTDYQNIMKLVDEGELVIAPAEETLIV